MAKNEPPKPKWYKAVAQAFDIVRKADRWFLPLFIVVVVAVIGAGVTVGFLIGSLTGHIYANLAGVLTAVLAGLILLTSRIDKAVLTSVEGRPGGSLAAAQMIRRGWKFEEEPIAVGNRGQGVVFAGVGKPGVALLVEGGNSMRKVTDTTSKRLSKLLPGVPIHSVYVGNGSGQVPLKAIRKTLKGLKNELSRRERGEVASRMRSLGGARLPVPKGVDPMRARPNRKAMRG